MKVCSLVLHFSVLSSCALCCAVLCCDRSLGTCITCADLNASSCDSCEQQRKVGDYFWPGALVLYWQIWYMSSSRECKEVFGQLTRLGGSKKAIRGRRGSMNVLIYLLGYELM